MRRPRLTAVLAAAALTTAGCGDGGGGGPDDIASLAPTLRASSDELVFSDVRGAAASAAQTVTFRNDQRTAQTLTSVTITGPAAGSFALATPPDYLLEPGATASVPVRFVPGSRAAGPLSASLTAWVQEAGPVTVELYGLPTTGVRGDSEPPLAAVLTTLGHPVDVGSPSLVLGTGQRPLGAEVVAPLFRAAGEEPVTLRPVARYSPDGPLPYGWYRPGSGGRPTRHPVGELVRGQARTLNPTHTGPTSLDGVGTAAFGVYARAAGAAQDTFTQERLNTGPTRHAVRVYPLHERSGAVVPHGYVLAFEDKANGDYQDHVYVLRGVTVIAGA